MHRPWRSSFRSVLLLVTLPATLLINSAWCEPAYAAKQNGILFSLGPLTKQQRLDDFNYLCGVIEEQYAPLQLKEEKWGFKWEEIKASYREKITRSNMSHVEFGALMQQFVANLHDGHTRLIHYREAMMNGMTPRISTLGFTVERRIRAGKSSYVVKKVFPHFFGYNGSPVQSGDELQAIDGRTPEAIILEDLAIYNTTGREDSDLSRLATDLTVRFGPQYIKRPMGHVKLTINRGDKPQQVHATWVDTDFSSLQRAMRSEDPQGQGGMGAPEGDGMEESGRVTRQSTRRRLNAAQAYIAGRDKQGRFLVAIDKEPSPMRILLGEQSMSPAFEGRYYAQPQVMLHQALQAGSMPEMEGPWESSEVTVDGLKFRLFQTSEGPAASYRVEDFMWSRVACEEPGSPGQIFLMCRLLSGEDYARAFGTLSRNFGVRDLVLDLRDNGGGALAFSDELLRAFTPTGAEALQAALRLNEMWLGWVSGCASNDDIPLSIRANCKVQEGILRDGIDKGERISSPVFMQGEPTLAPNPEAQDIPRVHVLINESCASACDIFAAEVQDAKLGTIIGRRSMGAGGNVAMAGRSPHEGFALTQTQSLVYRADGSFLENAGVTPDVLVDDNEEFAVWAGVINSIEAQSKKADAADESGSEAGSEVSSDAVGDAVSERDGAAPEDDGAAAVGRMQALKELANE